MATDTLSRPRRRAVVGEVVVSAAFGLGALLLAGEAAVHIQQYASLVHGVRWIGPLFLANAVACAIAIAGLAYPPTRLFAALAGIVISSLALASLVVSYGRGLFGFREGGFRAAIAFAGYHRDSARCSFCARRLRSQSRSSSCGRGRRSPEAGDHRHDLFAGRLGRRGRVPTCFPRRSTQIRSASRNT